VAEENINTDQKTKKDEDELTPDELTEIAGGQESNVKSRVQEQSAKSPGIKLNHNQTLVHDPDEE
jgi:hypothetical protein